MSIKDTNSIGGQEMNIKELRESTGMKRTEFCQYFNIPYRTVENWESGKIKCAEYLFDLLEYKLKKEGLIKED